MTLYAKPISAVNFTAPPAYNVQGVFLCGEETSSADLFSWRLVQECCFAAFLRVVFYVIALLLALLLPDFWR